MAYLNSVLDIAKTAIFSTQKALNVTSHNIANANTEGYTRQRAELSANEPINFGGLYFGTGVSVSDVRRIFDSFQESQLRGATSTLHRYSAKEDLLSVIEANLNDVSGSGLSSKIDEFFNSFLGVSNDPSSYGERSTLISNATILAETFNTIDASIRQGLTDMNEDISSWVSEINSIATQIADLNSQIAMSEIGGVSANDLRDKRDLLLGQLSEIGDIQIMEAPTGAMDVYMGGTYLVTGVKTSPLELEINADNPEIYNIVNNGVVINDRLSGGAIKGVIDAAEFYKETQTKLDKLALTLAKEVNLQHRDGYGLDGSTGLDFFQNPVVSSNGGANTGGAMVTSASVTDLSLLTLNTYEVRFTTPANYFIVNSDTDAVVATGAYTSGNPITIDGITFTITDVSGTPASGDKFTISAVKNAAMNISVDISDPNKVAASATAAGVPGDNVNALALAALKDSDVISGTTLNQYYNGIVTELGVVAKEASTKTSTQARLVEELQTAKESVSGVSLEEEAVNLVKLQRAYEAAAKLFSVADEMLQSLLNIR